MVLQYSATEEESSIMSIRRSLYGILFSSQVQESI